ncbi:MAG TPA: helix-turn-helix domain-containing protein, partial [Solirubrobacteraceae bacterium]|nr:helix-turn-helix domain-containing protein [Solirubrobacteraceae bacterium]
KAKRVPMGERRQQLLDHALALAAEEGFDALTVESIARRAGVSRVIVYRAYASLQVLLLALLERENRRMREQLERLLPDDPGGRSARQVMEEALTGFLGLVMADPQTWRVALQRPESAPKALQLVVSRRRADLAKRLRPLVAWGIQRLDAPPDELDPELVSRLLLTAGEELGRIALTEPELPPARLIDSVTRVVGALPWR